MIIPKALAFCCIGFAIGIIGENSYEDEQVMERQHCENVKAGAWGKFKDIDCNEGEKVVGNVTVKMKLSPTDAGKLYMKCCTLEDELKAIAKTIHYPDCWDTAAYPTLQDAITEVGCNPECCTKPIEH